MIALAVGVGEQRLVPVGQQARRQRRLGGRQWCAREVAQLAAVLVGVGDRLEPLPRGREVALGDARPRRDVAPGRGPEGAQVALEHERGRVGRVRERAGVEHEARAALVVPVPGGRELDSGSSVRAKMIGVHASSVTPS